MAPGPQKKKDGVKENWDSDSDSDEAETNEAIKVEDVSLTGFLRLPKEIRLEIYKLACLPVHTLHRYLPYDPASRWGRNALTVVHTYASTPALLATCKQIHCEITALLKVLDQPLGRETTRLIGDASCLDAAVFRGLLHCAAQPLAHCSAPRELVESFGQDAPRNIMSHEELHGLLDGVGWVGKGRKLVELAIEAPDPGWWKDRAAAYWAGLSHDVPRFDTWARTKSREVKISLEVVVRPARLSETGMRQWVRERPLELRGSSRPDTPSKAKAKSKTQRITRSEGALVEGAEWEARWQDRWRSRTHFIADLHNDRFGARSRTHSQGHMDWTLFLPRRKSFGGDWMQKPQSKDTSWRQVCFAPWGGCRKRHLRDRFRWRELAFEDAARGWGGAWRSDERTVLKVGSVLMEFHAERETMLRGAAGNYVYKLGGG